MFGTPLLGQDLTLFLEAFKARLDGVWSNLVWWEVSPTDTSHPVSSTKKSAVQRAGYGARAQSGENSASVDSGSSTSRDK